MSTDDFARSVNILQPHSDSPTGCAAPCEVSAPLHLSPEGRGRIARWRDPGEGGPEREPNPGQAPSPGMAASAAIPTSPRWGEVKRAAQSIPASQPGPSRREFLATAAAATGALVVGFWMPRTAAAGENLAGATPATATWATDPAVNEVNAWVVVAPDETVTIRIAQTELGQGVWTSNAMMVAEELQCDWSKVRPEYASANRDGREMAARLDAARARQGRDRSARRRRAAIRRAKPARHHRHSRHTLPAHAHQRRRLRARRALLPAARRGGSARAAAARRSQHLGRAGGGGEIRQRRDHPRANRAHRDLWPGGRARRQDAASAPGADPHQAARGMDSHGHRAAQSRCALKSHRQNHLRHRRKTARHEMGGGAQLPGLWRHREILRFRRGPQRARRHLGAEIPDSRARPDPRAHLLGRRRRHRRSLVPGQGGARQNADRMGRAAAERRPQLSQYARDLDRGARPARQGSGQSGRLRPRLRERRQNRGSDLHHALSAARPHGARQCHRARHRRPGGYLDRRPEPAGDALLGVKNHRHSGSQRLSAPVPPRRRLRPQRQRPAGRAGDLYRQPAPRHAHPPAVDARGGFHRLDLPGHGRRPPARRARCRRLPRSAGSAHRHGRDRPRGECHPSTGRLFILRRATGSPTTLRTSTCRSARGAASVPRRTTSTARAFWTNSPTLRARTPTTIAAS